MLVSPFTFYRGAALPMAADLAAMLASRLRLQLYGDAHLSNLGAFASPERRRSFPRAHDEPLPCAQFGDRDAMLGAVVLQHARIPRTHRSQLAHRVPGVRRVFASYSRPASRNVVTDAATSR